MRMKAISAFIKQYNQTIQKTLLYLKNCQDKDEPIVELEED